MSVAAAEGLSCPVIVSPGIDRGRDDSQTSVIDLIRLSPIELAAVDPIAMNLIVAKGLPQFTDIDIAAFQDQVWQWAGDLQRRCRPAWEREFHATPQDWDDDLCLFRLGMVCQYLGAGGPGGL